MEASVGPEYSAFWPYAMASADNASRRPTVCLSRGWMFPASPTSMITAIPVWGTFFVVRYCASRKAAQFDSPGCG